MKPEKPKKTWLITDLHLLHDKTIEYCNRPSNFNERLYKSLRNIPDNDILICLGDNSCNKLEGEAHERFIKPLNCTKIMIRGNHDKRSDNFYMNHGWDFVCISLRNSYFGKVVVFSHHPKQWDGYYDYNVHGHFHNIPTSNWEAQLVANVSDKTILLSCEDLKYQPICMDWFISKAKYRDALLNKHKGDNSLVYREFKNSFKDNRGCFYFTKDKIIGEGIRVDLEDIWE